MEGHFLFKTFCEFGDCCLLLYMISSACLASPSRASCAIPCHPVPSCTSCAILCHPKLAGDLLCPRRSSQPCQTWPGSSRTAKRHWQTSSERLPNQLGFRKPVASAGGRNNSPDSQKLDLFRNNSSCFFFQWCLHRSEVVKGHVLRYESLNSHSLAFRAL